MSTILQFADRQEFRDWLYKNCLSDDGVWLLFGKSNGPKTLKAEEALEEALCFGWIDGQMQSIDEKIYKKYFSKRRPNSKWSEKNKALTAKLEEHKLMTDYGRQKINEAKQNGQWDAPKAAVITDEQITSLHTQTLKECLNLSSGHIQKLISMQKQMLVAKNALLGLLID